MQILKGVQDYPSESGFGPCANRLGMTDFALIEISPAEMDEIYGDRRRASVVSVPFYHAFYPDLKIARVYPTPDRDIELVKETGEPL